MMDLSLDVRVQLAIASTDTYRGLNGMAQMVRDTLRVRIRIRCAGDDPCSVASGVGWCSCCGNDAQGLYLLAGVSGILCDGRFVGNLTKGDRTMPIKPEHLDELLAGYEKPEDLTGEDGLFKQLKKALIERALGAELTRASRLREGRSGRPRQRQQPQRHRAPRRC